MSQLAARPPLAGPVLRMVEFSRVRPHEEADPKRVDRLVEALEQDGVLRNPPIVAPLARDGSDFVVLDGANRVAALRRLGAAHLAVQVVRYEDPEVRLLTWAHRVTTGALGLVARVQAGGLPAVRSADGEDAWRRVRARRAAAAVVERRAAITLAGGASANEVVPVLHALVALYGPQSDIDRIEQDPDGPPPMPAGGEAFVLFPMLTKAEVAALTAAGVRLPAGITRHLIPGRALRCNVPLDCLRSSEDTAVKQARWDRAVEARRQAHGVRYYAESTYLFDD